MNMVMKVLSDHKQDCVEQGRPECDDVHSVRVNIQTLSEAGMAEDMSSDTLALFVSCS